MTDKIDSEAGYAMAQASLARRQQLSKAQDYTRKAILRLADQVKAHAEVAVNFAKSGDIDMAAKHAGLAGRAGENMVQEYRYFEDKTDPDIVLAVFQTSHRVVDGWLAILDAIKPKLVEALEG